MSRIRSVHPGFFTDEDLVCVGMAARLLFIGLGVEADDKGIFEWKPLTIKMRLFPADHVMVEELLAELVNVGAVRQYEIGGRKFGAIRNFRKFQKPKTPNDIHPATPEILAFVGLISETHDDDDDAFPRNGETFPPKGEKSFQMEEGGEKERKKAYAFSARVVRLTRKDYDNWREQFSAIPDFDAELSALDAWLVGEPEAKQRKWFGSGASWLARRHQEHSANRQRAGPKLVVPI